MQDAVARAQCKTDMRSRMESVPFPRNHSDDIAAAQFGLDFGDLAFWNFVERSRGHVRFHARKRPEQRPVCSEITIMSPADAHLAGGMRNAAPAKLPRHVVHQTAPIVIVKPVFQI